MGNGYPPVRPIGCQVAYGRGRGPLRTDRTWLAAILVGVLVGVVWAIPLFFLLYLWFIVLPIWLLIMLVASGICFLCGISNQRVIAYGVGLLVSILVTIGALAGGIALASMVG